MTKTPNHNYNKPNEGTTNWHIPLNENFEQLDCDIAVRDLKKNRQEYEPKDGTKFEAIDTGAVYIGNGNEWDLADRQVDRISAKQLQSDGPRIVSPSISGGYDSLQAAIDDAAGGGSRNIWVTEDIQENVVIPTVGVTDDFPRNLHITGNTSGRTMIGDAAGNDTPIIEIEAGGNRPRSMTFSNLLLEPQSFGDPTEDKTRAFSWSPEEEGYDREISISNLTIANCRFEAPTIIGVQFFTTLWNSSFRSEKKTTYDSDNDFSEFGPEEIAPALLSRGGNQIYNIRCNFVDRSLDLKYGAYWGVAQRAVYHAGCHYNVAAQGFDNEGNEYYADVDREVGAILLDTCGDQYFSMPYCESPADAAVVFDAVIGNGPTSGASFQHPRLHQFHANMPVHGLAVEGPEIETTIQEGDGFYLAGSYVRDNHGNVNIESESDFLRVYREKHQGWATETPPTPVNTGPSATRQNNNNHPVLVYDNGGSGRVVRDWETNTDVEIPGNEGPVYLGLQDMIYYVNQPPTDWQWFGLE